MGTAQFDMLLPDQRKPQNFIVYPMQKDGDSKVIKIQSDKRLGNLDLETGKLKITKSYAGGAYNPHYTMDDAFGRLKEFTLSSMDIQGLKMYIFTTAAEKAGTNGLMYCDNSNAKNILDL